MVGGGDGGDEEEERDQSKQLLTQQVGAAKPPVTSLCSSIISEPATPVPEVVTLRIGCEAGAGAELAGEKPKSRTVTKGTRKRRGNRVRRQGSTETLVPAREDRVG